MSYSPSMPQPNDPLPGDYIRLLNDGKPTDTLTRVRQILADDPEQELWEVRDSWGQVRIITRVGPNNWLEVEQ